MVAMAVVMAVRVTGGMVVTVVMIAMTMIGSMIVVNDVSWKGSVAGLKKNVVALMRSAEGSSSTDHPHLLLSQLADQNRRDVRLVLVQAKTNVALRRDGEVVRI